MFYTAQGGERDPQQMCWLWMLNVMKCLVIYGGDSAFVVGEVVKFLGAMRQRIYNILSVPSLLANKQINALNYGYMEELEVTLGLLSVLLL